MPQRSHFYCYVDVIFYLIQKHAGLDRTDDIISFKSFKRAQLIKHAFTEPKLEEKEFSGSILMGICAGARQDRSNAGARVTARSFLNTDTTQPDLDIALNSGGISGIGAPENDLPAQTRGSCMSVAPQQLNDAKIMRKVTVTVVNARRLPIVVADGGCDLYVEITVNDVTQKTDTISNIGVRSLRGTLRIFKPQIVYIASMAGDTGEIRTDPSSDPSGKDANFLAIQKIPLKLSYDYKLAPVFGGVIQRYVGNSILDVQDHMNPIKGSENNARVIRDIFAHILNEKN